MLNRLHKDPAPAHRVRAPMFEIFNRLIFKNFDILSFTYCPVLPLQERSAAGDRGRASVAIE